MIEIVYEKEKQKSEGNESFSVFPISIRQIGEVGGTQKIYIEDYAYTYLCRISSENLSKGIGAVLLGQANWKEEDFLSVCKKCCFPSRYGSQRGTSGIYTGNMESCL